MRKLLLFTGMLALLLGSAVSAKADYLLDGWSMYYRGCGVANWTNSLGERGGYAHVTWVGNGGNVFTNYSGSVAYDYLNGVHTPVESSYGYIQYYFRYVNYGTSPTKNLLFSPGQSQSKHVEYFNGGNPVTDPRRLITHFSMVTSVTLHNGLSSVGTYANLFDFDYLIGPGGETGLTQDLFVLRNPENIVTRFEYDGVMYEYSYENTFTELTGIYADYAREVLGIEAGVKLYGWQFAQNADGASRLDFDFILRLAGDDPTPAPTPEPATITFMGIGLAGLLGLARRRKKA